MRNVLLILFLGCFLPALSAGEQLIAVTPQALAGWSVTGATKAKLSAADQLSLPAGAQLSRAFGASAVFVQSISRPAFSATPSEWPVLEVGPAALVLIEEKEIGRLVLVLSEDSQVDLPWRVPRVSGDAAVELILGYDPLTGAVLAGMGEDVVRFETASTPAGRVDVVVTAGAGSAWPHERLAVLLVDAETTEEVDKPQEKEGDTAGQADRLDAALGKLRAGSDGVALTAGVKPGEEGTGKEQVSPAVSTLEIFTPRAVRLPRAEAIRNLVSKAKSK